MQWHPREILELNRWEGWDDTKDTAISTRSHWMRLFACDKIYHILLDPMASKYARSHPVTRCFHRKIAPKISAKLA